MTQVLVEDLKVLPVLYKNLMDPDYLFSDQICSILSNLSRNEDTCKTVFKVPIARIETKGSGISSTDLGAAILTDCLIFVFSRFFRRRLVCLSWWTYSVQKVSTSMQSSIIWHPCCPTWRSFLRPGTSWWTRTGVCAHHVEGQNILLSLLFNFFVVVCMI